jgi:RimJ/RimL family protein N-acetyltransferase
VTTEATRIIPPTRIQLGDDLLLRLCRISDARAVARSVRESLEHLRPWMPWADEEATRETFQRQRLRGARHKAAIGEEWQYGLFPSDESSVLGTFGLIARKWPATIEIGYWVHVDWIGRGYAKRASRALTNAALALDGITTVYIRCDEANARSAAVPRGLGFTLVGTETRPPQAPAESGQLMTWERTERLA